MCFVALSGAKVLCRGRAGMRSEGAIGAEPSAGPGCVARGAGAGIEPGPVVHEGAVGGIPTGARVIGGEVCAGWMAAPRLEISRESMAREVLGEGTLSDYAVLQAWVQLVGVDRCSIRYMACQVLREGALRDYAALQAWVQLVGVLGL